VKYNNRKQYKYKETTCTTTSKPCNNYNQEHMTSFSKQRKEKMSSQIEALYNHKQDMNKTGTTKQLDLDLPAHVSG